MSVGVLAAGSLTNATPRRHVPMSVVEDAASAGGEQSLSPVAPRFLRETSRGSKRQFVLSRYEENVAKKQMVRQELYPLRNNADSDCSPQVKPPGYSHQSVQQADDWIFRKVTSFVVARAKALEKDQLKHFMSEVLLQRCPPPPKIGNVPQVKHVVEAMFGDYFP